MANKKPVAKKAAKEVEVVEQVIVPTETIEKMVTPIKENWNQLNQSGKLKIGYIT